MIWKLYFSCFTFSLALEDRCTSKIFFFFSKFSFFKFSFYHQINTHGIQTLQSERTLFFRYRFYYSPSPWSTLLKPQYISSLDYHCSFSHTECKHKAEIARNADGALVWWSLLWRANIAPSFPRKRIFAHNLSIFISSHARLKHCEPMHRRVINHSSPSPVFYTSKDIASSL